MNNPTDRLESTLLRIATALERLAPPVPPRLCLDGADAFIWHATPDRLEPVIKVNRVPLGLLCGIEPQSQLLFVNTQRFAKGLPANNALLWGARGMGKSSLIKAVHGSVLIENPGSVSLIEIAREDIMSLPRLLNYLRSSTRKHILFCDDLSFDAGDESYKSLKAVLEGGVEGRPPNVVLYATSNRRHLMARDMIENERSSAISPGEAVEEKVSLSDRFGLWIGFHACDQDTYLAMVESYAYHYRLGIPNDQLRSDAVQWALGRGARSGRVAWQFIQDAAGRVGCQLDQPALGQAGGSEIRQRHNQA